MKPQQPRRLNPDFIEISENISSDINAKSTVLFISKVQLSLEGSEKLKYLRFGEHKQAPLNEHCSAPRYPQFIWNTQFHLGLNLAIKKSVKKDYNIFEFDFCF